MKKTLLAALTVSALSFIPLGTNAQSVTELGAQVQSLLAQIAALQAQLGMPQSQPPPQIPAQVPIAQPISPAPSTPSCPQLYRTLSLGMQGTDVLALQKFLVSQGLVQTSGASGYFDYATQSAVQQLQSKYGIATSGTPESNGFGVVGPRTRTLVGLNCASAAPSSAANQCPLAPRPSVPCAGSWSAITNVNGCTTSWQCAVPLQPATNPTSSNVPLTMCSAISLICPNGTRDQIGPNCSHSCVAATSVTGGSCATDVAVAQGSSYGQICSQANVALRCPYDSAYVITPGDTCTQAYLRSRSWQQVGQGQTVSLSASPNTGQAPLTVSFATSPITLGSGNTYSIAFGDTTGSAALTATSCTHSYPLICTYGISHTYTTSGTYNATLVSTGPSGAQTLGTATVVVSSQSNSGGGALSASPSSGTPPLSVAFSIASTPGQYKILYFGDGSSDVTGCQITSAWTTSHTYSSIGVYYPYLSTPCSGSGAYPLGSATITVATTTTSGILVSLTIGSGIAQRSTMQITWQSTNAPSNAAVALYLASATSSTSYGIIAGQQAPSGSYQWTVPGPQCNAQGVCQYLADSPMVYFTNPGEYKIVGKLYTPSNAYLGGYPPASIVYPTYLASYDSPSFTITSQ
ncbi:MAG: hypothetical protein RLZZ416_711 [Candidatus Parcubacteria bacterium]|jgi:PKD repeat protein